MKCQKLNKGLPITTDLIILLNSSIFSNAYKCSVFFEDLTPRRKLTWIGALPDALKKAKNKDEAREILGADVTEESFNNFPGCQDSAANARCYTTVSLFLFLSDNYLLPFPA